ncbi:MAG: thermonuclease family protein [Microbacterium sp.]
MSRIPDPAAHDRVTVVSASHPVATLSPVSAVGAIIESRRGMRGRMRQVTTARAVALAIALTSALAGCVPQPSPSASVSASTTATFVSVVDGDTIRTSAGRVRLIGIDTPERDDCGYDDAAALIERMLSPGDEVALELPPGENDTDRFGRLLRFVATADGEDVGLAQLQAGNAVARYDSTDGYPWHPREEEYHAAQLATRDANGRVVTVACG